MIKNTTTWNSLALKPTYNCIRIICGSHWRAHTAPLFINNNLLTLPKINKFQICLFMFRFHFHLLPMSFKHYFTKGSDIHGHFTRHSHSYRSEFAHLRIKQFSIKYLGPLLWNGLPGDLTSLLSFGLFKNSLKRFLLLNWWICIFALFV